MASVCFWRPLKVEEDQTKAVHLGLLDRKTVQSTDCVRRLNVGPVQQKEGALSLKQNDAHKWFYYPNMTLDEVILFTQFEIKKEIAQEGDEEEQDQDKEKKEEPEP